jgi:Flp pilus assembly protein TadD
LQEANGAFRKALEIDPTYDKARANLGSMLCGEGDVDGAKETLQVMKQAPAPGFDVEGGYQRCQ